MKYLFEAIDARQHRRAPLQPSQPKYDTSQLKQVVAEASEGLDDKSSMTDFIETLERIVMEIKNTTEHSGAFLQKVRKSDYPDYYEIIKRPMDLATLQKRVKQGLYRNKKAFAEDLDLIWSNCLIYNSLPTHPLRTSAEILRQKSNSLLEFISDPALPARSLYAQSLQERAGAFSNRSNRATPALDDDEDEQTQSDVEMAAGIRAVQASRLRKEGSVASAVPNGVFGKSSPCNGRDATDSPAPSDVSTPLADRRPIRKLVRGPLGRETISVEPEQEQAPELPFEDRPAIVRTPQCMLDFLKLDQELERLDVELIGWTPSTATKPSKSLLPRSSSSDAPMSPLSPDRMDTASSSNVVDPSQKMLLELCRSLNPTAHPLPTPPTSSGGDGNSPDELATAEDDRPDTPLASSSSLHIPITSKVQPDETPDELWWDTVSVQKATAPLATLPHPATVLAAGIPLTPWTGGGGELLSTSSSRPNKRKLQSMTTSSSLSKGKSRATVNDNVTDVKGLTNKMRTNFQTLREIKKTHNQLTNTSKGPETMDSFLMQDDTWFEDDTSNTRNVFSDPGIPKRTLKSYLGPKAATEAMTTVTSRVLCHAGFDASSSTATNVLTHIAAEYLTNLGRSLRFFTDRYGQRFSDKDIIYRALETNGVKTPGHLSKYVSKEIHGYGQRLQDVRDKLVKARNEQIESVESNPKALSEQQVFDRGCEALIAGETSKLTGEDVFGIVDLGLDIELGTSTLSVPLTLLRGEPKGDLADCGSSSTEPSIAFTLPPPYPVLAPEAVAMLPGLLQPYFELRMSVPVTSASIGTTANGGNNRDGSPTTAATTATAAGDTTTLGLIEDFNHSMRPKHWPMRPKVPPGSGRIPVKGLNKKKAAAVAAMQSNSGSLSTTTGGNMFDNVDDSFNQLPKKKKKKFLLQQIQQQV
ncbi:Transcriptional activator spt7 [Microbotryomycetes sp. JL221]|nr:Transcriptional activator spt7 [Microbotryomycetes sp. JL221]